MRRAIGGLIAVLRRFKIEAGTEELADWIWYAAQRGASIERTEKPFESEKNSPAEKAQSALARKPQSAPAKKPQSAPAEKPQSVLAEKPAEPGPVRTETRHEPAAEVYSPPLGETEAEREQKNDLPFRSPGGRALPHPLEITQALRPLIRHVPSADGLVLNEATTAQQIAQSDVWLPIFKKKSARWLELLLVIEESPSMRLWHHTVKELRRLLEQQGAFRDVRTRILKTGAKTQAVGLYTEGAKTSVNYRELINPVRKRLIFVITDCISPAWQSEPLLQWLDAWGKVHPLTIVQMLPQTLWPQTRLRNARFVMVNTPGPAAPNRFLKSGQISLSPWLRKPDELKKFKQIAHPLVTLEPGFLENWAKAVAGAGDIAIPAFLLKPERISGTRQPQTEIDEDKRLRDFRAAASPTAFRLAVYLAAAPLRLPIMRLVQRVMLPESRQVHLAEFFLSGLIKRAGTGEETGNPDEIDYDFIGSLRDKLLDAGLVTDAVSVQESVSEYIAEHYGSAIDFQALIANPEEAKNIQVASGHEKFAKVTRKVLERLGPNYSKVIGQLSEFRPFHDLLSDRTPGPAMIFLAGGFFRMGDDKSGWDNEKPAHLVILNEFSVGQYPVTFEEYDLFCEAVEREKPNDEGWGRGKRPVINVSWDDAVAYCEWLSEQTGQTYRLLTEAEWEYACRAGSETAYGFGNDEKQLAEYAWYDENREKGSVHPVGKKKPNGWGVYDMLGNVLEWVQDWYGDYSKDTQTNPNGLESGSGRVVRGGSWKLVAKTCRSTYRGSWIQDDRNHSLGFRLARTGPLSSSPFTLPDMTRLLDGTFNTSVSQLPISRDHVRDFWVDSIMKESSRIWATNIEEFTGSYGRQVKSELLKAQALAILRGCEIKRVFVYSIQEILDEKKRKMLLDVMMAQSLLGIDVYAIRDVDFYGLIDYEKSIGGKDFIVINHRALYITHFKEREVSSTELMVPENVRELKKVEKAIEVIKWICDKSSGDAGSCICNKGNEECECRDIKVYKMEARISFTDIEVDDIKLRVERRLGRNKIKENAHFVSTVSKFLSEEVSKFANGKATLLSFIDGIYNVCNAREEVYEIVSSYLRDMLEVEDVDIYIIYIWQGLRYFLDYTQDGYRKKAGNIKDEEKAIAIADKYKYYFSMEDVYNEAQFEEIFREDGVLGNQEEKVFLKELMHNSHRFVPVRDIKIQDRIKLSVPDGKGGEKNIGLIDFLQNIREEYNSET